MAALELEAQSLRLDADALAQGGGELPKSLIDDVAHPLELSVAVEPWTGLATNLVARDASVGIEDRVGSLEVGKDADFVIKRGSLFDPRNPIERVIINGRTVYVHGQRRKGYSNSLKAMQAMIDDDGCMDQHPDDYVEIDHDH